jgi:3-oxoacyl-[acyl-carrier-protein] synthase II
MDRSVKLAWLAARQALYRSGLEEVRKINPRAGVMVGSSRGPLARMRDGFARVDSPRYPPSLSTECTLAVISGVLSQKLLFAGPGATVSATCASGAVAIIQAAEQILLGKADLMLAGAAEAPLIPSLLAQLDAAGVLGSHADPLQTCRPFDRSRNGLCAGEGSAFLLLESLDSARRRGQRPLARLSGWSTQVDIAGRAGVHEEGHGLVNNARQALGVAGLTAGQIDYVNAHGTGTRLNDAAEARAMRTLFGDHANNLSCTSTKPITGHCLGATAALEAVISLEALARQTIPPTANCLDPDPDCPINPLPRTAAARKLRHVMSNSLGFWGYHASLIFSTIDA